MSGNYPPGMSKRDFVRAGIDQPHHHEHEFEPDQGAFPLFEDAAALFSEHCMYAEGEYGQGFQCEETRYSRCELVSITVQREGAPDIEYLESEDKHTERFGIIERIFEDALVDLEMNMKEPKILDLDPPGYGDGFVKVNVGNYILEYKE